MYFQLIQQFSRTLHQLDGVLAKADAHAKARNWDPTKFLTSKLAPDMLPFVNQIRISCDTAKNAAAGLSGQEPPKHEDNEQTFDDLRGRIAKCLAYLEGFKAADFEKTKGDAIIKMPNRPGKGIKADDLAWVRQLPNFYFHAVTAYDILRAGGVDVGKTDFLGKYDLVDL